MRVADVACDIVGKRRRAVVARLHHDLVERRATGVEHAAEHARRVVLARHVIQQADEVRPAPAEAASGWIRVVVELANRLHHAFAREEP